MRNSLNFLMNTYAIIVLISVIGLYEPVTNINQMKLICLKNTSVSISINLSDNITSLMEKIES